LENIANAVRFLDTFNPRELNPLKPIMDKIDTFLARYYLIDYDTLVKTAKAEDFDKNDYSRLSKTLKKKLFRSRAKIYLSALADTVEKGHKLEDILDSVKLGIIPYIKKEIEEPTFNVIYELLKTNP